LCQQIGRSSESPIDFVVIDTITGDPNKSPCDKTPQSTISRFACRVLIDRKPPHTARIYAAGFDSSRNIFLGEKATKWQHNNEIDGLTTNGVLIMHPKDQFCQNYSSSTLLSGSPHGGVWREVSVCGEIYAVRETRSASQKGAKIESETNILIDGTLIDLCGATLLWRSADGLSRSPTKKHLEEMIDELNAARPQCPVGLNTLVIPRRTVVSESDKQPYVYLNCGHVQGLHDWGQNKSTNTRTCPMCLKTGPRLNYQWALNHLYMLIMLNQFLHLIRAVICVLNIQHVFGRKCRFRTELTVSTRCVHFVPHHCRAIGVLSVSFFRIMSIRIRDVII